MTADFEQVLLGFLILVFGVIFYLAGKADFFTLVPKIFLDRLEELNKKHGTWIEKTMPLQWCDDDVDMVYKCSVCEAITPFTTNYCHNCGVKMDGKENAE